MPKTGFNGNLTTPIVCLNHKNSCFCRPAFKC